MPLLKGSFFCAPAAVNLRCCSNPIKAFVGHYGLTSWLTEHKEAASGHRERELMLAVIYGDVMSKHLREERLDSRYQKDGSSVGIGSE